MHKEEVYIDQGQSFALPFKLAVGHAVAFPVAFLNRAVLRHTQLAEAGTASW